MAIVQRTREATRSSAFACELRAADSPRPLAFISNLSFLSAGLVQGWPKLQLKGDFLQYSGPLSHSCACGNPHRELRGIDHRGRFATQVAPMFLVVFWSSVLEGIGKALRDGVSIQNRSDQEDRDGAKAMSDYSSSPWFTMLSRSPDSHMGSFDKFVASSLSSYPFSRTDPSVEGSLPMDSVLVGRVTSISSGMAVVGPTVGGSGHEQAGAVEVLRESRPVVVAGTGEGTAVVDVGVASEVCDYGAVHARGSSGSRVRDRCLSAELGFRMSRFNGSSWVSFSSQHSRPSEPKSESPADPSAQFGHDEQHDHSESEERVVHTSEDHEVSGRVPLVVPSRAWVDEVKTLKKGDVYVGRGSRQRGLLPSFWANRYKVSKFGRDRAVELHATEVQEDPQYRLRIHELSGKRLLCHCRTAEKCHADNLRDLFRTQHPQAYDPSSSARPPLSSELNILAKAREDREDSEESGLEDAEADAPHGWSRHRQTNCSSDQGMSKGGCATVRVSARQVCGRRRIAVILPHSCGRASRVSSWGQQNPSHRFSSCQNLLWVVTRSLRSVMALWIS